MHSAAAVFSICWVLRTSKGEEEERKVAMHEAYEVVNVLDKLPRQIESIACHSKWH